MVGGLRTLSSIGILAALAACEQPQQGPATGTEEVAVLPGTETFKDFGDYTVQAQAANALGADTETWIVRVISRADFDADGDVDLSDFAAMQRCFSGEALPYPAGCDLPDLNADGDVDGGDFAGMAPCMAGANHVPGC